MSDRMWLTIFSLGASVLLTALLMRGDGEVYVQRLATASGLPAIAILFLGIIAIGVFAGIAILLIVSLFNKRDH